MRNAAKSVGSAMVMRRSVVFHQDGACDRCGGFMVGEFCTDMLTSAGEPHFLVSRCVQCGDVIDPVILQNRRHQQEAKSEKSSSIPIQLVGREVAA